MSLPVIDYFNLQWRSQVAQVGSCMADRVIFEDLAMVHMEAAYNLAFSLLRARADAEDAVQDSYVRAYRALHQLRGDEIKPWLLTIVRNVCYRRLQERRRTGNVISLDEVWGPRTSAVAAEAEIPTNLPSPEQALISASDQTMVNEMIGALPPVFREVIILREIEELSYGDIANIIGAPIGTVMSRLSRARSELRGLLKKFMDQGNSNEM